MLHSYGQGSFSLGNGLDREKIALVLCLRVSFLLFKSDMVNGLIMIFLHKS